MTHDRSDSIHLPADMARCEPVACTARGSCARYQAALPAHGGSKADLSDPRHGDIGAGTALCGGYINVAALRKAVAVPQPKRVHPAPRGI